MQKTLRKILAYTLPFILTLATLASLSVSATPATTVYVDPRELVDLTLTPGCSFYLNISVLDASNVWGYGAALAYNTSILTATNTTSYAPFTTAFPAVIDDSGIENLRPLADGVYRNWTGNFRSWDEITPDGDGTYVSAGSAGLTQSSTLGKPRLSPAWDKIKKVSVIFVARQTTSDEKIMPLLLIGRETFSGSAVTPPTTYEEFSYDWDKNPSTNSTWSWTDMNTLEAGVRSEQNGATFDGELRVTQLFVKVYNEAGLLSVTFTKLFGTSIGETGSFPLLKVGFNVDGNGTSILDLYNTKLSTPVGGEIAHGETDGMFTNVNIHDVAITSVTSSKYRIAAAGELLTVDVTVANHGDFDETFYLTLTSNESLIGNQTDIVLNIDENTTLSFTWNTTSLAAAEYTLRAQAILSVLDNHPDDNIFDIKVRVGVIRDIAIISVTPLPTEVYLGEAILITVSVRNRGNFTESCSVTIKYDNSTITTQSVSNLQAGQTQPVDFSWETAGLVEGTYIIRAEAVTPIDDNPTNNVAESIPVKLGAGGIPVTWIYAGIALLAIIILLIVVYVVRKIRKRKPEQPT